MNTHPDAHDETRPATHDRDTPATVSSEGVLIGTTEGVFRASGLPTADPNRCLNAGIVHRLVRSRVADGILAATGDGLYRTANGGRTWTNLGVPTTEVYAVTESAGTLYAGTLPAAVYRSDDGETWSECRGFQDLPGRENWPTDPNQDEVRVHSLTSHPEATDRLLAGVEVAGLFTSTDRGKTWRQIHGPFHDDVHQVVMHSPASWVLAGREGVYRTADAGQSWTALGLTHRRYVRQLFIDEQRLYVPAARTGPFWDGEAGADASLFVAAEFDGDLTRVPYPGSPKQKILSWCRVDGQVVGGTTHGTLLAVEPDDATVVGHVPVTADASLAYGVTALCPL